MRDGKSRTPKRKFVRCLGPGREHQFLSADPRRNRVCDRCHRRILALSLRQAGGFKAIPPDED